MIKNKAEALLPLVIADIYELAGRFRDQGDGIARAVGQTQARWQVMSVASAGRSTVPQIARRLGVTRQNVQRIADALVAEGWAGFEPNPDHRSSPCLILNARGRGALAEITKAAKACHAGLARKFSGSDVRTIHRALRRLLDATADWSKSSNRRRAAMNTETIADCMRLSFADTPFPVVMQKLAAAGVSAYTADLIAMRKTYYGAGADSVDEPLPLTATPPVAADFDAGAVAAALKAIQQRDIGYADFLRRIMAVGCVGYRVFFGGRKAMYFGRDGDFYIEPFPPAA